MKTQIRNIAANAILSLTVIAPIAGLAGAAVAPNPSVGIACLGIFIASPVIALVSTALADSVAA